MDVLELVISDDLRPPLQCPLCGWLYVHCSIQIPSGEAKCPACAGSFTLPRLARSNGKTHSIPSGLTILDQGWSWTIGISTRSPSAVLVTSISVIGLTLGIASDLMHSISLLGGNGLQWLVVPALCAGLAALLACAAYWRWGRHTVSANGALVTVFKGVGRIGTEQSFRLPVINGVCLTREISEDHQGKQIEKSVIRLEGVDFYMNLGQDLADEQRAFIALFLLQKRIEYQA